MLLAQYRMIVHTGRMKTTLLSQTFRLMERTRIPVVTICRDLDLTPRWYYKLKSGELKEPGVNRIQRLHDYLAKHNKKSA